MMQASMKTEIQTLLKQKKYDAAKVLLEKAVEVEEDRVSNGDPIASWYFERLAILYRKAHLYAEEYELLSRYSLLKNTESVLSRKLEERICSAKDLLARQMRRPALLSAGLSATIKAFLELEYIGCDTHVLSVGSSYKITGEEEVVNETPWGFVEGLDNKQVELLKDMYTCTDRVYFKRFWILKEMYKRTKKGYESIGVFDSDASFVSSILKVIYLGSNDIEAEEEYEDLLGAIVAINLKKLGYNGEDIRDLERALLQMDSESLALMTVALQSPSRNEKKINGVYSLDASDIIQEGSGMECLDMLEEEEPNLEQYSSGMIYMRAPEGFKQSLVPRKPWDEAYENIFASIKPRIPVELMAVGGKGAGRSGEFEIEGPPIRVRWSWTGSYGKIRLEGSSGNSYTVVESNANSGIGYVLKISPGQYRINMMGVRLAWAVKIEAA